MTKRRRIVLAAAGIVICAIIVELVLSNFCLKTTQYKLSLQELHNEINVVFLSDLHNHSFGADNASLLREVADSKPDVIAVVGDMMEADSGDEELTELLNLLTDLVKIAPTFVSYGNHDFQYEAASGVNLTDAVKLTGAIMLEEAYEDVQIGDTEIRIGGMYSYAFAHHQTSEEWSASATYQFLSEFENTELPKIL